MSDAGGRTPLGFPLKVLIGCGAFSLCCCLLLVAWFGIMAIQSGGVNQEASAARDRYLQEILPNWDLEALIKHADDEIAASSQHKENFRKLFDWCRRGLGPLVEYDSNTSNWRYQWTTSGKLHSSTVQPKFERGDATVQVVLREQRGAWRIYGIYVQSPALMNAPDEKEPSATEPSEDSTPDRASL